MRTILLSLTVLFSSLSATAQSWVGLGTGTSGRVNAIHSDGAGNIYAGGWFANAGNITSVGSIARWDGSAWSGLGSGTDFEVFALKKHNGTLYAGGNFSNAGGGPSMRIARWDGNTWSAMGTLNDTSEVRAIEVYNGSVIRGGGVFGFPANPSTDYIARWDGSAWVAMGQGVDYWVYAMTVYNNELIVAGGFTNAGGQPANFIAKWDGSSWSPLGSGLNASVHALLVHNGELYAAGAFTEAGGNPAGGIAKWNGSSWTSLTTNGGFNNPVYSIAEFGGDIIVAGTFTIADGSPANYIARWNGSSWSAMGGGMNNVAAALVRNSNELYAGGAFTDANGTAVNYIASTSIVTAVEEERAAAVRLEAFPNPCSDKLTITCDRPLAGAKVSLFDVCGKKLFEATPGSNERFVIIERGSLRPGMYFWKVEENKQVIGAGKVMME